MFQGKLMVLYSYIRKEKRLMNINISIQTKWLRKEQQNRPKESRRKDIVKI